MAKKAIPDDVRAQVVTVIEKFNHQELSTQPFLRYTSRFRGRFLYLDRVALAGKPSPICRMAYDKHENTWDFAIYKYSDNGYAPDEWWFPGYEHVDGTIKGAMMAGIEAYPE